MNPASLSSPYSSPAIPSHGSGHGHSHGGGGGGHSHGDQGGGGHGHSHGGGGGGMPGMMPSAGGSCFPVSGPIPMLLVNDQANPVLGMPRSISVVTGTAMVLFLLFLSLGHSHNHPRAIPQAEGGPSEAGPTPSLPSFSQFVMQPCIELWNAQQSDQLRAAGSSASRALQGALDKTRLYLQGEGLASLSAASDLLGGIAPEFCSKLADPPTSCRCQDLEFIRGLLALNQNKTRAAQNSLQNTDHKSTLAQMLLGYLHGKEGHQLLAKVEISQAEQPADAIMFSDLLALPKGVLTAPLFQVFEHSLLVRYFGFAQVSFEEELGYARLPAVLPHNIRQLIKDHATFSLAKPAASAALKALAIALRPMVEGVLGFSVQATSRSKAEFVAISILGDPSRDPAKPLCVDDECIDFEGGDVLVLAGHYPQSSALQHSHLPLYFKRSSQ